MSTLKEVIIDIEFKKRLQNSINQIVSMINVTEREIKELDERISDMTESLIELRESRDFLLYLLREANRQ